MHSRNARLRAKSVLLISGLDDPGYAWKELGPVLVKNGFSVFVFVYPNDQSIEASTSGRSFSGLLPRIDTLIMVGTPHQGSQLSRFRIFLEIRDQVYQRRHANATWLHGFLDGTGSAGIQLLPGSSFLRGLNQRRLPSQVSSWMIAGRLLSFSGGLSDVLGDGLVSMDSGLARGLAQGAESAAMEVSGSHMGMLTKSLKNGSRLPSAIPLILEILSRE